MRTCASAYISICAGVPQGSILGPLICTIFTFNFCNCLQRCNFHFYADDSQLYFSFTAEKLSQAQDVINSDLSRFYRIATDHLLKLNPSKSSVIIFGNQTQIEVVKNNIEIKLNNATLPFVDSCKSLGLILDSRLRFKDHVKSKLRVAYGLLKLIFGQRHYLSVDSRKMLSNALVLSQFNHCSAVYYPCLDSSDRCRIQKVQNACLRMIYGVRRRDHITPYLKESKWLHMFNRFKLHMSYFYFKIIRNKLPVYLYVKASLRSNIHSRNMRRRGLLTVPRHRKELFKRSFSYNIATLLNSSNVVDWNISNLSFKHLVKQHLLRQQYFVNFLSFMPLCSLSLLLSVLFRATLSSPPHPVSLFLCSFTIKLYICLKYLLNSLSYVYLQFTA